MVAEFFNNLERILLAEISVVFLAEPHVTIHNTVGIIIFKGIYQQMLPQCYYLMFIVFLITCYWATYWYCKMKFSFWFLGILLWKENKPVKCNQHIIR